MLRRPISISLRLTVWFGASLLCGWLLFGAAMWFNLKHALAAERKQTLDRRLDRLQDLLQRDAERDTGARYNDLHDFASATGNGLVEIFQVSGSRFWHSPSIAAETYPWPKPVASNEEQFLRMTVKGQPFWTMQRPFRVGLTSVVLMAAAPDSANVLLLHRFLKSLLVYAPVLLLVSMAGGYWISRRALSPVDAITAAAHAIGIRNLSERLPLEHSSDELGRLARTWNDMLRRLEEAVRKLNQFTADASHELRGPLAMTRTIAEVTLRNPHIDAESRAALQEIAGEMERSAVLLAQMLELARADNEPADLALVPVELGTIAAETCAAAGQLADQRQISVRVKTQRAVVLGHLPSLRRMVWILLDNAIKYNKEVGFVTIAVTQRTERVVLEVTDNGIGMDAEDLPRIFDRFYRADPSRSDVEGSGLGLSIAKWIADLHHASVSVESKRGEGTTVSVDFPAHGKG